MTIAPPDRIKAQARRVALAWCRTVIRLSGVGAELESRTRAPSDRKRRGPEHTLGQYNVEGIYITRLWLALADKPASTTTILEMLWTPAGFTDAEMDYIGLGDLRHTANRYERVNHYTPVWHAEYKRLDKYLTDIHKPCDNTANTVHSRQTRNDVAAAREQAAYDKSNEATLLWKICNAIVAASIDPDVIAEWGGDLAVDETLVPLATNGVEFNDQPDPTPEDPDAVREALQTAYGLGYPTNQSRRYGFAHVVGVTLAVAANDPYKRGVPRVALGIGFAHDENCAYPATLTAIDAADRFRPKLEGNEHQYVYADMAYIKMTELAVELLHRNYDLITDLPKGWLNVIGLRPFGGKGHRNPTLAGGAIHCPGVDPRTLASFPTRIKADMTDTEIRAHKNKERQFRAGIMPTHHRFEEKKDRGRGRPRAHAEAKPPVYKAQVYCPAAILGARAKCALKPQFGNEHLPSILTQADLVDYPTGDNLPGPCKPNEYMATVVLDADQYRRWSHLPRGTFEQADHLHTNRSDNERTNGTLKRRDNGGNLTAHTITTRRNPSIAVAIAMRVAVANLRIQEAWREGKKDHTTTTPPRLTQKRHRDTL